MEAYCDWLLQEHDYQNYVAQEGDAEVSDILLFEQSLNIETKTILNADLVPWVDGFARSDDRDRILGVMRIIWISPDAEARSYKISDENMRYLLIRFGLERIRFLGARGYSFQGGKSTPTKKQTFALRYNSGVAMYWTYDFMTHRTEAVFEGNAGWGRALQGLIQSQQRVGLHPLFMGLIVVLALSRCLVTELDLIQMEIQSVEVRTRHNAIRGGRAAAAGSYAFLSARMSGQAQSVAFCERTHALLLQSLDWLSEFRWPQDVKTPSWLARVAEEVDECSRFVRTSLKGLEPKIRSLSKRADIQLTAVSHTSYLSPKRLSL